ncbi:hypothetical protein LX36DRAFT_661178 [Colletotrichum falcatum]|nr:hypothetical protein LX36DRAFT_661178 [Colletotrichum falcatum]
MLRLLAPRPPGERQQRIQSGSRRLRLHQKQRYPAPTSLSGSERATENTRSRRKDGCL